MSYDLDDVDPCDCRHCSWVGAVVACRSDDLDERWTEQLDTARNDLEEMFDRKLADLRADLMSDLAALLTTGAAR